MTRSVTRALLPAAAVSAALGCGAVFACSAFDGNDASSPDSGDDRSSDARIDAQDAPAVPADADASCIISLSVGSLASHSCAVKSDGTVWCWGANTWGQLGIAGDAGVGRPVRVDGVTDAVEVSVGYQFTCARTGKGSEGHVVCWGRNDHSQIGVGPGGPAIILGPTVVTSLGPAKAIACGAYHACAITLDDHLQCWGYNQNGELGTSFVTPNEPYPDPSLTDTVRAVSCGHYHTCAITEAGALRCWGNNEYAELGVGVPDASPDAPDESPHPTALLVIDSGTSEISAGDGTTCATVNGRVSCWGSNIYAQTGTGLGPSAVGFPTPLPPALGLQHASVGRFHACATQDAGPWCWGSNLYGALGPKAGGQAPSPILVGEMQALSVHTGAEHTCARLVDGPPLCWGTGMSGELGRGAFDDASHPDPAPVVGLCP